MIVPYYWSQSKVKKVVNGQQFTVMRFGWSDESEEAAKQLADSRLAEAIQTLESEGDVRRIDRKVSYNGSEGVPIREEVIEKIEDIVISRNAYGALCLNTPDVLFADIDFDQEAAFSTIVISGILVLLMSILTAVITGYVWTFILGLFLSLLFASPLATLFFNLKLKLTGGVEKSRLQAIEKTSAAYPTLHMRVYRTPNGFRVLIMNDTFSPTSEETVQLLKSLNSDSVYIQMCKNQKCFRARISPKPWRIGVERLKPRPGIWPIKPEKLAERERWVRSYEHRSRNIASCHFVMSLGSDDVHQKAERVQQIHDEKCLAMKTNLPLA